MHLIWKAHVDQEATVCSLLARGAAETSPKTNTILRLPRGLLKKKSSPSRRSQQRSPPKEKRVQTSRFLVSQGLPKQLLAHSCGSRNSSMRFWDDSGVTLARAMKTLRMLYSHQKSKLFMYFVQALQKKCRKLPRASPESPKSVPGEAQEPPGATPTALAAGWAASGRPEASWKRFGDFKLCGDSQ